MKPRILIVDDSSLARRMTRQALEELGYTVEEASDGTQALERYFLNKHDLVVLDMVMTGMYGLEVLTKMRQVNPLVKVIVATADIQQSTQDQARAAGASAFVHKPLNRKAFTDAVSQVLAGGSTWN
jgi:two-component system chemotaxis response regulator CheY